jgi:hypothetical protein
MSEFDDFLRELEEEMAIKYHLPPAKLSSSSDRRRQEVVPGSSKSHVNVVSNY